MISSGQNECLKDVAAKASIKPTWEDFGAYCAARERGLRKVAFQYLERFLASAKSWSFDERKSFVDWLCWRLAEHSPFDIGGPTPQPLVEQLIVPTLEEWVQSDHSSAVPYRWLGLYFAAIAHIAMRAGLAQSSHDGYALLEEALARDPGDQLSRIRLIEMLIGDAEYNCHHLPDYYIGNPRDDLASLKDVEEHLANVCDADVAHHLRGEVAQVSQLIRDWMAFTDATEADFNQWCADHGRTYHWVKAYYYSP